MSNEQNGARCEDCDELLKIHRGSKADWMTKGDWQVLFCPSCGQIYIKDNDSKNLVAVTIDEREVQGN